MMKLIKTKEDLNKYIQADLNSLGIKGTVK